MSDRAANIPEPFRFEPNAPALDEQLARLRRVPGIYLLSTDQSPLHLSWSSNLERRLKRVLRSLGAKISTVEYWPAHSRLELQILLYRLARRIYPDRYRTFLKMRLPWFLGLTPGGGFARTETANRLPARWLLGLGPFASRAAAQRYEEEILSQFQLRRCTETLEPRSDHPGCIYGEMNQCLRPCQSAVSLSEYVSEAGRVREFLETNGRAAIASATALRERASEALDFEQASLLHKRLEKLKATVALRDPVVRESSTFGGVALTAAAEPGACTLWPMTNGCWLSPLPLNLARREASAQSLDAELRDLLGQHLAENEPAGDRLEELAIFARWYYSSWRDGEWFPFCDLRDLNYRQLVRAISKRIKAAS